MTEMNVSMSVMEENDSEMRGESVREESKRCMRGQEHMKSKCIDRTYWRFYCNHLTEFIGISIH